eukprot:SAG11_NODE_37055_length_258_cov_1.308176_1_plen_61_part_01
MCIYAYFVFYQVRTLNGEVHQLYAVHAIHFLPSGLTCRNLRFAHHWVAADPNRGALEGEPV